MEFTRKQTIESNLAPKRALVVYGPRRVGKTTLLASFLSKQGGKRVFSAVGDDIRVRELFLSEDRNAILGFAKPYDIVAIDEAQSIPKIGLGAKMIVDAFPEKTLILTGSSSFDLSREVGEPLTGRHFTMTLLPIAQSEITGSGFEIKNALNDFLIYGSYPEVLLTDNRETKERILRELVSSYLFKDILAFDRIKSPDLLLDIVRALAFQVGAEVSYHEIARTVKTDPKTVARYLDVLEKMFVIKKVRGFSRNLRNEISKKAKYYFLDNGIRNAAIGRFNRLSERDDVGALWENFVFMELYKRSGIDEDGAAFYFWRTHTGYEIDIVKESAGRIEAIECKWSGQPTPPSLWSETYPAAQFKVLNRENYLDALL